MFTRSAPLKDSAPATVGRAPWRAVATQFVLIFAPLFVISSVVVGVISWRYQQSQQRQLEENDRQFVSDSSDAIAADFRSVVEDLMILASAPSLRQFIEHGDDSHRQAVENDYRTFLEHKPFYDQARYLNEHGREVVRLNHRQDLVEATPRGQLQLKLDRYYFEPTLRLAPGAVFVSPLDLNVENGRLVEPHVPTIRFATPIHDRAGVCRGMVVVNYLAEHLLQKLRRPDRDAGQVHLINAEGYWLVAPNPEFEWAFMFAERKAPTFPRQMPVEWRRMWDAQQAESRTEKFQIASGIYTFHVVEPLSGLPRDRRTGHIPEPLRERYRWLLLSHITPAMLASSSQQLSATIGSWLALSTALTVVSWLFARLNVEHQRARQQFLQQERLAAIGEAMTALAHESRNALQRSQAGLEMLQKRLAENPDAQALVKEIREAQVYLADLYEEVRGYAAPLNPRRTRTDLAAIVHKTWEQLIGPGGYAGAQLIDVATETAAAGATGKDSDTNSPETKTSADKAPTVTANGVAVRPPAIDVQCEVDAQAISQVIRNVLENALAAAQPPQVRIRWDETRLRGEPALRLAVRDNGPGVAPAERQRIFEPFHTTKTRGTGLGLAISRRIVAAHGGEIEVADAPGPGAEFWITVPRRAS